VKRWPRDSVAGLAAGGAVTDLTGKEDPCCYVSSDLRTLSSAAITLNKTTGYVDLQGTSLPGSYNGKCLYSSSVCAYLLLQSRYDNFKVGTRLGAPAEPRRRYL
jgi:hypothetical protein